MAIDMFDEQERLLIRKEFTYHLVKENKLKPGRNQTDLNTQFTEHSISSIPPNELLKNSSSRSIILAPFNSMQKEATEQRAYLDSCYEEIEDKDIMIRFGHKVREIDRKFEKFNNGDFDNGVYHKFAYKNQV
jgi:hypothetical protein